MTRRSLRPHLNQIRSWVRQGRTDAWIAHQLETTVQQIQSFRQDNDLVRPDDDDGAVIGLDDDEIELGPTGVTNPSASVRADAATTREPRLVAVAHGRDGAARRAIFQLLRAVGLQPLEWEKLVAQTQSAAPYSGEAVMRGIATAQAVVVLFTPDDIVQLHPDLDDASPVLMPRPNVLIEAGMALATHPHRTLLVVIGDVEMPSNLAGLNVVRLDCTPTGLNTMVARLKDAGCPVDRRGTDWLDTRSFHDLGALRRRVPSAASTAVGSTPDSGSKLSVFMRQWQAGPRGHEQYVGVVTSNISSRPVTVVSMGLRVRRKGGRRGSEPWKVDDGGATPSLPRLLQEGETVAMQWMYEELGQAFCKGETEIVGCFAVDGRGIEVAHDLPKPIG